MAGGWGEGAKTFDELNGADESRGRRINNKSPGGHVDHTFKFAGLLPLIIHPSIHTAKWILPHRS